MKELIEQTKKDLESILEGNYNKLLKRYPKGFEVERSVNRER